MVCIATKPTKIRVDARCAAARWASHRQHDETSACRRLQIAKCRLMRDFQSEPSLADSARQYSRQSSVDERVAASVSEILLPRAPCAMVVAPGLLPAMVSAS